MKHNIIKNLVLGSYVAILSLLLNANRVEAAYRVQWTLQAEHSANSIAFSPQNNILAVGANVDSKGYEGESQRTGLYLLSPKTGKITYRFTTQGDVRGVVFTPDGRFLLDINGRGESFGQLNVWDVKTKKLRARFQNPAPEDFNDLALSSDGRMAACATYKHIYLVDTLSGKLKGELPAVDDPSFNSLAFSPDGKYLLGISDGGSHGNLRLWDIRSGVLIHPKVPFKERFGGAFYLKNGQICLSGRSEIQIWDKDLTHILQKIKYPEHAVDIISIEKSEALIAMLMRYHLYSHSGGSEFNSYPVLIWNLQTRKTVDQLEGNSNASNAVIFLPDSSLVVASADQTVKLWKISG